MPEIRTYLQALMLTEDSPLAMAPGQVVFSESDLSDGRMYIVRTGSVELRTGDDVLEMVEPGGMIGELALIDPAPRSATAIAGADCTLTPVDQHLFHKLVRQVPGLALEMMRVLARRLRQATTRVKAAATRRAVRRPTAAKTRIKPKARPKPKRSSGRPSRARRR